MFVATAQDLRPSLLRSRRDRAYLRRRGIKAVIPIKKDQQANRRKLAP
ncbi:hypothetical protein ABZ912_49075 [Nonomuraea angiospora]